MIVFFVLSVVLVSWIVTKYILHMQRMEQCVKNLNTKSPIIPFFGNALPNWSQTMTEFAQEYFDLLKTKGSPFKVYAGPQLVVFIDKPEDMKTVLMSPNCVGKSFPYTMYLIQAITNIQSREAWKPIRHLLNPMFSMSNLQSHLPAIHRQSKLFIDEISSHVGEAEFDILHYVELFTLRCACATLLQVDIDLHANGGVEFIHSTAAIFQIIPERVKRPWLHFDFIYRWTNLGQEQEKHYANLRYLANRVFEEEVKVVLANRNKSKQLPLIQAFLEGKLSEEMTKQQIESLLIAGFDTLGAAISFSILMIAMHPEIQEQLVAELRSMFQTQDEETTYAHILEMKMLERVIKESMRLFPIAIYTARCPDADIQMSNCVIPKNTIVMLMYYNLHRRPEIWGDDADEFNPDHFSEENCRTRHPFAYLPFLAGPRNCPGYQQAMFTMKIVISAALRHYKFNTKLKMCDLKLRFHTSVQLENKHMVGVERRDW